tara:strand:- start:4024 stop:6777 length:2754 start_codon:yes stop_codon:yes gene_type:complete
MASITQNIPNYTGGISEQPDERKFPGQVVDSINAIPDATYGLYKRPGSKRVGTSPLASVASGGSWFHYYRDETEGSYIGQVQTDGTLNVWRCSDGTKMTTVYGTGGESAIKTYLSASNTEDVQFLTINDTTFVSNRDTTVATTGTTDGASDTHFAYVEILRTENGRQYSLNAYSGEGTTTITRATRLKIDSDTLAEGGGTGTCPGIGTQIFGGAETNTGSKRNLTFRITALGQQGQIGSYDDSVSESAFACSYNRQVQLLHGGEGWTTGDTTTVTLDQAKTSYNYTVKVVDAQSVSVKADLKAVRPAPTPFDADTAVTIDTIIGGIVGELSGVLSCTVIGNGIYLTSANAFQIEILDKDLMRVMQSEINDVSLLPSQCKDGYLVKVTNSQESDDDDYYLKFEGENGKDGPGSWVEVAAPGIAKSFNAATMPHVIQRTASNEFTVKQFSYPDRTVGDDNTNPVPTFVGKKINKVLFFRNRIAFLAGENVITCQPGTLGAPNFWAKTAIAISASDPIDISSSSMFPSDLYDGIDINAGLLVFSSNQQFLLSSDDTIMNPDTAKLRSVSTYNYNIDIPPISMGVSVGYVDNSGKYSRFNEMINTAREGEPIVGETSKIVPSLLPKDIDLITNSRENQLVLFGKTDSDIVYGFKYFQIGDKRQQAAWFKWKLNNPIKYHFIIDDDYYFLDTDNFLQKMSIIQADTDISIDQDDVNYLLHLDNYTTVSNGSYNSTTKVTTFTNQSDWIDQVTSPNGTLVLVDSNTNSSRVGRYAACTVINSDDFTVPGDWSGATLNIGYLYEYNIKFPTIYSTKTEGNRSISDVSASLILHRINLSFGKIGLYETTLSRVDRADYTEVYESPALNQYNISDAPYVAEVVKTVPVYEKNTNVDITLKSNHPAPTTLHSMSWEGDYSPMFYQRV